MTKVMTAKSVLWLLYGLFLLGLVVVWQVRRDARALPEMRAAAALPAGHLLATGDVALPGGPHYLRRAVKPGDPLDSADLSPFTAELPRIDTKSGTVPVVVRIEGAASRLAPAAGGRMWICQAGGRGEPVEVVSVLCGDAGKSCLAVVAMPGNHAATLAQGKGPRLSSQTCS